VKDFEYGIFWKFKPGRKVYEYAQSINVNQLDSYSEEVPVGSVSNLSLFIQTSVSMFTNWIMGFGMPGRVGYTVGH
jgi:hypothetical protein